MRQFRNSLLREFSRIPKGIPADEASWVALDKEILAAFAEGRHADLDDALEWARARGISDDYLRRGWALGMMLSAGVSVILFPLVLTMPGSAATKASASDFLTFEGPVNGGIFRPYLGFGFRHGPGWRGAAYLSIGGLIRSECLTPLTFSDPASLLTLQLRDAIAAQTKGNPKGVAAGDVERLGELLLGAFAEHTDFACATTPKLFNEADLVYSHYVWPVVIAGLPTVYEGGIEEVGHPVEDFLLAPGLSLRDPVTEANTPMDSLLRYVGREIQKGCPSAANVSALRPVHAWGSPRDLSRIAQSLTTKISGELRTRPKPLPSV